jgi:hypothetical protein
MLYYALIILFGVGVLAAYLAGVRRQRRWGTPVLVVCLLGVVGGVVARKAITEPSVKERTLTKDDYRSAAVALAGAIAGDLPEVANVCIVAVLGRDARIEPIKKAWEEGLREGAPGAIDKISFLTNVTPAETARIGVQMIDMPGVAEADAILYIVRELPPDTRALRDAGKTVAAFFPIRADGRPSITDAERDSWLAGGALDVIVCEVAGAEPRVYKGSR